MDEDTDLNSVHFQREELKFNLTSWTGEKRHSSSAQLTNPTNRPVRFEVLATGLDNYVVKPGRGIVPPSGSLRINVTARKLPPVEQREGKISVLIFEGPRDCRVGDSVFPGKHYHPPLHHHAISHCSEIRVRWVHPKSAILDLMTKAIQEVSLQNLGPALETLGEAIELCPDGFLLLCRALVNHFLGQNEGVKRDLQEAEPLLSVLSPSELDGGMGEHSTSSAAYGVISDMFKVPTYTEEKLSGKQMIVKESVAVTENRQLHVEVHFTPSVMQRPDGNVEVSLRLDYFGAKVVRSKTTDSYPDHFLQSLKIKVRPTGEWSESFSEGFGLSGFSPGNEVTVLSAQQGMSEGIAVVATVSSSPSVALQVNRNNTSGTTSSAFGFKEATTDGHAYVCEYELHTFADGSSTKIRHRRFYKNPKILKNVQDGVRYSTMLIDYKGTWKVPYTTAMKLRNQFEFTISLEAKLPAVRRCRKSSLKHLFLPPKHELEVRHMETRRICTFAIAGLKNFIRNGQ